MAQSTDDPNETRRNEIRHLHEGMATLSNPPDNLRERRLLVEAEALIRRLHKDLALAELAVDPAPLAATLERYQDLLERTYTVHIVTNERGVIKSVNGRAEHILGTPGERMEGKSIADFCPREARIEFRRWLNALVKSDAEHETRWTLSPVDGQRIDVAIHVRRLAHPLNSRKLFWMIRTGSRL